MIIGGIAVQHWGEPLFTRDLDLSVQVEVASEVALIDELLSTFDGRVEDAAEFARKHRVLLLRVPGLTDADLSFALPGYEEEALARVVPYDIGEGRFVHLCSAEDLIIYKSVAGRSQDMADIEGILRRNLESLDLDYVRRWLHEFGVALDMHEILDTFEKLCHTMEEDEVARRSNRLE